MPESYKSHLNRLYNSPSIRNVAVVAFGTACAQAITMAFSPLITRLYGPDVFGVLGTFLAMLSIITPVGALAYPMAIVLPQDDGEALGLAKLSSYLTFEMAFLVALALWGGGVHLIAKLGIESIAGYLFIIPLAVLFSGWVEIAQQWLIRKRQYSTTARVAVIQSLLLNCTKAGVGWYHPVAAALIGITTIGYFLHAVMLGSSTLRTLLNVQNIEKKRLSSLAKKYKDFPMYRAPQNFINAASQSFPVLMLAGFFGPESAGFYTLGKMVMGMPSTLVGKSVSDVFYPRITEAAHNGENLARLIVKATQGLMLIGIIPFSLVMIFGPWLFSFVFGPDWIVAGEYARWLAVFFFFNFINKPSVSAVPVLGIQRGLLVYELFSTGSKVIGILFGFYYFKSDIVAVALFSIVGSGTYISMIFWIIWNAKIQEVYGKTST